MAKEPRMTPNRITAVRSTITGNVLESGVDLANERGWYIAFLCYPKELLSFIEVETKDHSPPAKKPRLDSPEVVKKIHPPQPIYPWNDEPTGIRQIEGDNNCFYRSLALLVYKYEEEHERARRELMEFLLVNKQHSWVKYFGSADGVEEYVRKFSRLGQWGSSMQLLLATKLYNTNFVLYQPESYPHFIPFFVDKVGYLTDTMEPRVGFIRLQGFLSITSMWRKLR